MPARRGRCVPHGRWEARFSRIGLAPVAGLDEAGRGSLAGPVVAAAVVLHPRTRLPGLRDSKDLTPAERERLLGLLLRRAADLAWAWASPREIERLNILQASFLAMRRALRRLKTHPAALLVDGPLPIPGISCPQEAVVRGDSTCRSIAAAGIVAKVIRDDLMARCHRLYPQYGFLHHRGYATPEHLRALAVLGVTPLHRRTFVPVAMTRPAGFLAHSW